MLALHVALPALLTTAPCDAELRAITARVQRSLEWTLTRHDDRHGPALAAQVARLLRWRGDVVRNIHPGDRIAVLYDACEEPELAALRFDGRQLALKAYRFAEDADPPRYFDENGTLVEPRLLSPPVTNYVQITEVVQGGRGKRKHTGLDLKAPEGTPVLAPWEAVVSRVNWRTRINGYCVELAYDNGRLARFLHLSKVRRGLKPGMRVSPGETIGFVGSSGRSSAPHLHYDLRKRDGTLLDPLTVHGTERVTLSGAARQAFDETRARFDSRLGSSPAKQAL